jgi:hypothetical protein
MDTGIVLRALGVWSAILVLAVLNGALREKFLLPVLGSELGFSLSGVVLAAVILLLTYLFLPWIRVTHGAGLLYLGIFWVILTLAFEFSFGMLLQGKSWHELLQAYTLSNGNIWPLVLFITGAAPCLAAKLRGWV